MILDKIELLNQYILILEQISDRTAKLEEQVYNSIAEFNPDKRHTELVTALLDYVNTSSENVTELKSIANVLLKNSLTHFKTDLNFIIQTDSLAKKEAEVFLSKYIKAIEDLKKILE